MITGTGNQLPGISVAPPTGTPSIDDANIAAAIAKLPASGGTLWFSDGAYVSANQYNLDDKVGVRIRGGGGTSGGAAAGTAWTYTGTASSFISGRSCSGFEVVDMQVLYSNAAFTGLLFDFSHSTGLGTDANNIVFERCGLGGSGIRTAAILASLDNAIIITFRDTDFYNSTTAVRGRSIAANYSNVVNFDGCVFTNTLAAPILNPGQAWSFRGCAFEGLVTGAAGAPVQAGAGAISCAFSGVIALGVRGCWFGDATAAGFWIDAALTAGSIKGNYFATGNTGISQQNSSAGNDITGNAFYNMTVGIGVGTGCSNLQMAPNYWDGTVTTPISFAALPIRSIYGNPTQPLQTSQLWARDGVYTKTGNTTGLTSAQIDALFQEAPLLDGLLLVDTTNQIFLQRSGGKWYKSVALTLIA